MKNYRIIDAHVHLPWQDEFKTIDEKLTELKRNMQINSIDYAIVIADSYLESCIGSNEEVINAVSEEPNLFCLFGYSPLERQKEQLEQAELYIKKGQIKGIKLYPGHENFSMNDIRLVSVFELCVKYNIPIAIHTEWNDDIYPQYSHPFYISEIAKRYPELKIVCCHMWLANALFCFEMIKDLSNVYIDISSFMMGDDMIKKYKGFPDLHEATEVLDTIISYCEERIIYGSDYGSLSMEDHRRLMNNSNSSESKKKKVMFDNANKVYKLRID